MKKIFLLFAGVLALIISTQAQVTKVKLQASGLTCSMCSKAVYNALKEVPTVEKVLVDIKNQQYSISFREGAIIEPDALSKAVEDAGFSVASLQVTATVAQQKLKKDAHVKMGDITIHFLNAGEQEVSGEISFQLVDKNFVPQKEFKKYADMTDMKCVQTGRMEACCSTGTSDTPSRIYHAIL